ncbi:hypothetical protein D3C72_1737000 [compost metagenome]
MQGLAAVRHYRVRTQGLQLLRDQRWNFRVGNIDGKVHHGSFSRLPWARQTGCRYATLPADTLCRRWQAAPAMDKRAVSDR